jgi:hypothetical integral membrane protein (TIGR02206 family)
VQLLAADHIAVLATCAALCSLAVWVARARPGAWVEPAARVLAVVIATAYVVDHVAYATRGGWSAERNLPLHLTDAVTVVAIFALWRPTALRVELTYFWALTASLQALLTPELSRGFPVLVFFTFFATHGGALLAAVFLVFGRGLAPRSGAVWRVYLATAGVAAVAAVGNLLTGGNYMFLRRKPRTASLLDLLGDWPWYVLSAAGLALVLFLALDAPFRRRRHRRSVGARTW